MTRDQLLSQNAALDYSAYTTSAGGEEIPHEEALKKIGNYTKFKTDHGLDQTISIGFDSKKLMDWMSKHQDKINEIKVFLGLDDEEKFIVVFWPYQKGLPAVPDETDQSLEALSTYNIGSRMPMIRQNNES